MNSLLGITNKTMQHVTLQMLACEKLKVFSRQNYLKKPLTTQISRPNACRLLSLGPIKGQSVQKYTLHNRTTQRCYTPRDSSRRRRHFGKSIPEFGETHSSVLGYERRPVSASTMSRSCFASFPVCVYKFSSHYLNNIIFYRQYFGNSSDRITLYCAFEPRVLSVQITFTLHQICQRRFILIIECYLVISSKWRHENPQFAHTLYSYVICFVLTTYTDTFLNTINRPPFIMKAVKTFCKVGTEFPSTIEINFDLQRGKKINMTFTFRSQDI